VGESAKQELKRQLELALSLTCSSSGPPVAQVGASQRLVAYQKVQDQVVRKIEAIVFSDEHRRLEVVRERLEEERRRAQLRVGNLTKDVESKEQLIDELSSLRNEYEVKNLSLQDTQVFY